MKKEKERILEDYRHWIQDKISQKGRYCSEDIRYDNHDNLLWDKIRYWDIKKKGKQERILDIWRVAWLLPNGFSLHQRFPLHSYLFLDYLLVLVLVPFLKFSSQILTIVIFLSSAYLIGISNCTWSSCRHGCTAEVYKCWQVQVSNIPYNHDY